MVVGSLSVKFSDIEGDFEVHVIDPPRIEGRLEIIISRIPSDSTDDPEDRQAMPNPPELES